MRSARASGSSHGSTMRLPRGERLMGFGHRVYRVRDPRADVLKAAIEAACRRRRRPSLCRRGRGLYPQRAAQEKSGPAAGDQCRVLHRDPARCAGDSAAGVHADLRGGARRRLDRACARAAAHGAADPAELVICGGDAGAELRRLGASDSGAMDSAVVPAISREPYRRSIDEAIWLKPSVNGSAGGYGPGVRRDDAERLTPRAPRS